MNVSEVINFHGLLRKELHHMLLTSHHADSQFCTFKNVNVFPVELQELSLLTGNYVSTMGKYVTTYLQFGTLGL